MLILRKRKPLTQQWTMTIKEKSSKAMDCEGVEYNVC